MIKNVYNDISFISDEEINEIIALCDKQLEIDRLNYHVRRDERNYVLIEEIRVLKSVFEVIKNNEVLSFLDRYKLEQIYEKKLEAILQDMHTEEMKHTIPRTPPVYSINDYVVKEKISQPTILYYYLPNYSSTLADMCADQMQFEQPKILESKETKISLPSLEKYKKIDLDLGSYVVGYNGDVSVSEKSKTIATETANIISETEKKNVEVEQQKKELEIISLQQEINLIENKKLEIEKRIKQIMSETGSFGLKQKVEEKYPNEYQNFQKFQKQVINYESSYTHMTDLKEKFSQVSKDLQFYQSVLPAYESFYQRYEQIKIERDQEYDRKWEQKREQKRIYNLIYSEENERLKKGNSLYTAWDLGNKVIPQKYQGLSYEQVEAMITQEREQERLKQLAQVTREDLINKAIRKKLGAPEDYYLSDVQIRNLRVDFDGYSVDQLRDFVEGVKKENPVQQSVDNETKIIKPMDLSYIFEERRNKEQRTHLINEILEGMYPNGLEYVPLPDIMRQLEAKSTEELQTMVQKLNSQAMVETSAKKR